MKRTFSLAFSCLLSAQAQVPRFEDYPEQEIFKGKPAPPKIVRPRDRLYRTRIREGAAQGPNFAGHYTVASWGCGAGCVSMVLVDAKTGIVYGAPFQDLAWGGPADEPLEYKLTSTLIIVHGCPGEKDCATYYYQWTGSAFKLLRKDTAR